jgi:dihydrodipicolinate synthase/N-acetylneuraminate lyase
MPISASDPIVAVPVATPFDADDHINLDALARNVERWLETPLAGFIIGSATGDEWFLSEPEKLDIARAVSQVLRGDRFVIGGIDSPSVTETLHRAEAFAEAGAEVVRVRLPRYEDSVESYFEQVLPRCPLPVLLMHQCNPERYGYTGQPAAKPEVIGHVCNLDNVFGYVTDHDPRFEARVRRRVAADRRFWICNGSMILFGTLIGCNGTTTAFANLWPEALADLLRMGMAGEYEEARPLQEKVQRIDAVMLRFHAAGVKAAMRLLGFEGMRSRSPIPPLLAEALKELETEMREAGLLTG